MILHSAAVHLALLQSLHSGPVCCLAVPTRPGDSTSEYSAVPGTYSALCCQMTPENQAFLDKLAKDGRVGPDEEAARFPMAVGPLREDKDHLGEPASVCDIIMNPTIIRQAHDFRHA